MLTDAHLVDVDGRRVGPTEPLVVGREYRLLVSLAPGLEQDEPDGQLAIRAPGAVVGPTISLSLFGAPLGFDLRPVRRGRLDIAVEHLADDGTFVIGRLDRNARESADSWPPPSPDRAPAQRTWPAPTHRQPTTGGGP
jgi:hypothetical protein